MYIYVLGLNEGKYYIGQTTDKDFTLRSFKGCLWTQTYKPKELLAVFKQDKHIDDYILLYMRKYGIDSVRGGYYDKLFLTKDQITYINSVCGRGVLVRKNKPEKLDIAKDHPLPFWVKKGKSVPKKVTFTNTINNKCISCECEFDSINDLNIHKLLYCTRYCINFTSLR